MTVTRAGAESEAHPAPIRLLDDQAFLHAVDEALSSCIRGIPSALMHVDVARAQDIGASCGGAGVHALRDLLQAVVHNQLGPIPPANFAGACGLSLLLRGVLPADAVVLARRMRTALDNGTFTWQGHPFRLGAHIGLVELGPDPGRSEAWVRRAREACSAARELGGSGIQFLPGTAHALGDLEREREWHVHLAEVI